MMTIMVTANDLTSFFDTRQALNLILKVIRSGDQFNALAEAAGAIIALLELQEGTLVHLCYQEKRIQSDTVFRNFRLPARYENGRLQLNLFSGDDSVQHFESSEVPFYETRQVSIQSTNPSYLLGQNGELYFFVWSHSELIAAVEIQAAACYEINSDLTELLDALSQCLSFSLQNLNNDLQLITFKKQLEKQKQEIMRDKKTIERQNQIFRSLMETMSGVNETDMESMFNYCLSKLRDLFPSMDFGLIVDGEREGIVQWACFLGLTESEQGHVLDSRNELFDGGFSQSQDEEIIWNILPMTGQAKKSIGRLLIRGKKLDEDNRNIVILFLKQLSAYTENKLLIRQLERIANLDGLTGAFNRHYFHKELERVIQNAERFQKLYFSIFLIDLNGLKMVNDTYGHREGDRMIIQTSQLLLKVCRKTDIVCRFGGDEFILLCPSTSYEQAIKLLNRLRKEEQQNFISCQDSNDVTQIIPIRLSIGISSSSEGIAPLKVMETADQRMYQDKAKFYETNERYR